MVRNLANGLSLWSLASWRGQCWTVLCRNTALQFWLVDKRDWFLVRKFVRTYFTLPEKGWLSRGSLQESRWETMGGGSSSRGSLLVDQVRNHGGEDPLVDDCSRWEKMAAEEGDGAVWKPGVILEKLVGINRHDAVRNCTTGQREKEICGWRCDHRKRQF